MIDLIGQKFNLLTVVSVQKDKSNKNILKCSCECGGETMVYKRHLVAGRIKSCGCIIYKKRGGLSQIHPIEFDAWRAIIRRCTNPNEKAYPKYGGRGITVCERWRESFSNFLSDMGTRPSSNHSIDRIKNDAGYFPENCRWTTRQEQNNNKRDNVIILFKGDKLTISQWAARLGCSHAKINARLNRGWSIEKTLTQ